MAWLSGVLLGLAFLPAPLGFLAWVAFVPLLIALDRRLAAGEPIRSLFGVGYGFGLAFFLIGTHWIALLEDVAITVPWLKYPAWLVAAAYLALFPALASALAGWLSRCSGRSLATTFPFAYLAVEVLRGSGELGFPWFQPGYTQHAYLPILQLASLGSVTLVTLWVLFVNVLLWRACVGGDQARGGRVRAGLGAALALALVWLWGLRVIQVPPAADRRPVVALVQGNIPGEMKWSGQHQTEILDRFLRLSDDAAHRTPRPALVIWPETATGSYLRVQLDQRIAVAHLAAGTGVPVFSGFPDYGLDSLGHARDWNAAGWFAVDGAVGPVYAKRHLVPLGERMPFQRWLPALGHIRLGQAEWTPGDRTVLFPTEAGPFSCLVCFESIFPELSRGDVRKGARWLVNITNDEWFGNSAALHQHAAMAVFRAVENHVPLARCANTGITMMVDAKGRVVERLPILEARVLSASLPPAGAPTLFTRVGDWPAWLAWLGVGVWAWGKHTRRDRGQR
ncbi:MAG TPA: apolipoprotein N-acyltransferase [Candidatus Eisenbacteria bacterium]